MSTFGWYALQITIAMIVFVAIGETVGVKDFGMAPVIVSIAVSYGATHVISWLVDWRRNRSAPKSLCRFPVGDQLDRKAYRARRFRVHPSDSAQLIGRPRTGQDPRQLP